MTASRWLTVTTLFLPAPLLAQQPLVPLDFPEQQEVIGTLAQQLRARYVFPDVAEKMITLVQGKLARKEYGPMQRLQFAQQLTNDLQSISHDKHLRVRYSESVVSEDPERDGPDAAARAQQRANHFGFVRTEILPGNVALLDLRGFNQAQGEVRDTAIAALKRLAGADALIVDLRRNGGGDPAMVALLSSALWPKGEKVHLNDLYFRPSNTTEHFFTDPALDVPRLTGPVFTVTSSFTFSAAEEFTYNLKQLTRATQVGETTGGGANPGGQERLSDHYLAFVPSGRAVNPITKTNWEGVGNIPEIPTPRDSALVRAYREALIKLAATAKTDSRRSELKAVLAKLERGEIQLK
jgi:hypothetical protein